jgi:hypothetical protein
MLTVHRVHCLQQKQHGQQRGTHTAAAAAVAEQGKAAFGTARHGHHASRNTAILAHKAYYSGTWCLIAGSWCVSVKTILARSAAWHPRYIQALSCI